jgi:hypothetical protein
LPVEREKAAVVAGRGLVNAVAKEETSIVGRDPDAVFVEIVTVEVDDHGSKAIP